MNGKTIIVTGGSGDLGAVVLPRLARDFHCIAPYRSETSRATLQLDNVTPVPDLTSLRTSAPIYALVHLAGGYRDGDSVERFEQMIETNLMTAVRAVQAVL
ncbi:MAG TPA: NAD-dependent epimerase/dehydratase family protein, partial [Thermoanaerobaculia bacterium]|nr:NAD-dependent epimerase/dehydratase family protein [Thermoanaerobaculia bacterium]